MPERQERIEDLFHAALEQPPDQRAAWVVEQAGDDVALRDAVLALLSHDDEVPSQFLAGAPTQLSADPGAPATPPTEIGGYRILRTLGSGGMGLVYEAEQQNPRRRVALKVIRHAFGSPQLLSRFRQEAQVLGYLRHPGIAQIIEAGTTRIEGTDLPYFSMELIEGAPLDQHARSLTVAQRVELIARVCDAVQHAHQRGVIHRDLKPSNIHVVPGDTSSAELDVRGTSTTVDMIGQPKVMDFGIARLTDADVQVTTVQTHAGQIVGTLGYMSPEQVAGDSTALDTRCDVYALGVILYLTLSGELPHDLQGRSIAEAARIVREEEPRRLATRDTTLRGDLDTIVTKALEKDPTRRYDSAAAMAEDLRRHLAREPISAHPPSALYQIRKFASRNQVLVGGILATFVALLLGLAGTSYYLIEANAQRETAERKRVEADEQRVLADNQRKEADEQRELADQRREEADQQRRLVEAQRDDLQAVQEWYAELISSFESLPMGRGLKEAIRTRLQEGLEREKNPEADAVLAQFDAVFERVNAADIAIDALDLTLFDRAEESIAEQFEDRPAIRADLYATVARAHILLSRGERALDTVLRAEDTLELVDEPSVDTIENLLLDKARAFDHLGRREEEIEARRSLMDACRARYGPEHEQTLRAASGLAIALNNLNQREEATKLVDESLALFDANFDVETAWSLRMRTLRAWLTHNRGQTEEALVQMQAVLDAHIEVFGPDHKQTLAALTEMGTLYSRTGNDEKGAELLRASVEGSERILGTEHALTSDRQRQLASVLSVLGEYDESIEMLQKVIAYRKTIHQDNSWAVHSIRRTMAHTYARQRRFALAVPLYRGAVEAAGRELGLDHPHTLREAANLGRVLLLLGRFDEANAVLNDKRDLLVAGGRADAPEAVQLAESISMVLVAQDRFEEALEIQTRELARARRVFGDRAMRTLTMLREHMRALSQAGRLPEAQVVGEEFLQNVRRLRNRGAIGESLIELGSIALRMNDLDRAYELLHEGYELTHGSSGTGTMRLRILYGATLAARGCPSDAEPIMLASFEELEGIAGRIYITKRRFELTECIGRIIALYEQIGDPDAAASWRERLEAVDWLVYSDG